MWQTVIVVVLVGVAALWLGRRLWRTASGQAPACGCGEGQPDGASGGACAQAPPNCACGCAAASAPQGLAELGQPPAGCPLSGPSASAPAGQAK